jgi:hypothetical protein
MRHQRDEEEHEKDNEQQFGDSGGCHCDSSEAKNRGN